MNNCHQLRCVNRVTYAVLLVSITVIVGAYCLYLKYRRAEVLPRFTITTVAKISRSVETGKTTSSFHLGLPAAWMKLRPTDVSEAGFVYTISDEGNLLVFDNSGRQVSSTKMPWLNTAYHLRHGTPEFAWISDCDYSQQYQTLWRLSRIRMSGKPLWHLGLRQTSEKNEDGTYSLHWKPEKVKESAAKYITDEGIFFHKIEDIFSSNNGRVFVLEYNFVVKEFDSEGKFVADYSLDKKGSMPSSGSISTFSAFVDRKGTIYCSPFAWSRNGRSLTQLPIDIWKNPKSPRSETVDLSSLGDVSFQGIRIVGVDRENAIYFQYISDQNIEQDKSPVAVAKTDKEGRAIKIFDIKKYYSEEIERERAVEKKQKEGMGVGIGDVVHVPENGDIYLEINTAEYYRVGKISFKK